MQKAIELVVNGLTLRGMQHIPDSGLEKMPAAVLFHGYGATKTEAHRLFVKICRTLASAGIACFRFDFSGSGESDGNFEDMTLSGEVNEAKAILDWVRSDERIDSNRVMVIGLSMGGLVASLVAGERREDVHKLVLLAPAGNMRDIVMQRIQQAGFRPDEEETLDDGGNLVGKNFALEVLALDAYSRAAGYEGPVLLIHGSDDPLVNVQASYDYQEQSYHGRASLHVIDGAGHTFDKHTWEQDVIATIHNFVK